MLQLAQRFHELLQNYTRKYHVFWTEKTLKGHIKNQTFNQTSRKLPRIPVCQRYPVYLLEGYFLSMISMEMEYCHLEKKRTSVSLQTMKHWPKVQNDKEAESEGSNYTRTSLINDVHCTTLEVILMPVFPLQGKTWGNVQWFLLLRL